MGALAQAAAFPCLLDASHGSHVFHAYLLQFGLGYAANPMLLGSFNLTIPWNALPVEYAQMQGCNVLTSRYIGLFRDCLLSQSRGRVQQCKDAIRRELRKVLQPHELEQVRVAWGCVGCLATRHQRVT